MYYRLISSVRAAYPSVIPTFAGPKAERMHYKNNNNRGNYNRSGFGHSGPSKEDMAYGVQPVQELLQSGQDVEKVMLQRELNSPQLRDLAALASEKGIVVQRVPLQKMNSYTRKNHQGVVAIISAIQYAPLEQVVQQAYEEGRMPLLLLLDRITDVRNFGAICRTAECAGADAVVVPTRNSAQITSDAIRTSAGALSHLNVCREYDLKQTVRYLLDSGLRVVACTEKAAESLYEQPMNEPVALILGSEEDGIGDDLLKVATSLARLPMLGKVNSLNVSVAAGIALFEAVRQRQ